jgi:hypothetical protein
MNLNLANVKLEKELIRLNERVGQLESLVLSKDQEITLVKDQIIVNNSTAL